MCDHRVEKGELPWCVESCPAGARIFGDLNDPQSPPSRALARHSPRVLLKDKGTAPKVFYIRDF
jgi:molybdopterin-containing oxidoreductase family iron-sulfur binding subunit